MQNPDYYAHPSAVIDAGCQIGAGSKIWHFSHLMAGAVLARNAISARMSSSPTV
jgi:UDP-2-acetamido-3-amino-2,3-dideoxy-glucuronate N-acetyltransferase